ncbi:MAG: hypothetical protein H6729_13295 [Deltaproteobacteria bacterium]|nr:hypothetical protein [Deltaproteobacteria bacterium]
MKFLLTGLNTADQTLYLINTNRFSYHYKFFDEALHGGLSLARFNARTYFTDARENVAGTLVLHDNYRASDGEEGLFAVEFWPTDPLKARHVAPVMEALRRAIPFAPEKLVYHPAGNLQEDLLAREASEYERLGIRTISTPALFENVTYQSMNPGVGFGRLRIFDGTQDNSPPTARDVVVFKDTPNDLTHVAGILTERPQTPLSHINLKAKQNRTPNAFVKDASTNPDITAFTGKSVRFEVTSEGFTLREATQDEVDEHLEHIRPTEPQFPVRDLSVTDIRRLDDVGFESRDSIGAKAANLAELRKALAPSMVPNGFAVPFSMYDRFMESSGLYDEARRMMAEPQFQTDPTYREEALRNFRRQIRRTDIPSDIAAPLRAMQREFPPDTAIRCRSSTNNEDLEGFNGAGLYDSYTHRPDEGEIDRTIKQVWASLWNFRAFEERDFYRIDHFSAAMGVLVHENFDDEAANGVALTRNIYDPNWPGFYVNVQIGEALVTNPGEGAVPDEFLISAIGPHGEWETQFIRHSNLAEDERPVLTDAQTTELRRAMEKIQSHFKPLYDRQTDPTFSMDIEFKIDTSGKLIVKQARPEVHSTEPPTAMREDALGALAPLVRRRPPPTP